MNRQPNSPYATIDLGKTDVCADVVCPCGKDFHFHNDPGKSAEFVSCPWCKEVLRVGAEINLLSTEPTYAGNPDPHASLQWKGTDVVMQANCSCRQTFYIAKDFAYTCDCPHCGTHYHCQSDLTVTRVASEDVPEGAHVTQAEKDIFEMDEEERAAYDAKMQELVATRKQSIAAGNAGLTAGMLIAHDHTLQDYGNAPPQDIVYIGDVADFGQLSRYPGNGDGAGAKAIVIIGDVHAPGAAALRASALLQLALAQAPHGVELGISGDYVDRMMVPSLAAREIVLVPDVHVADFPDPKELRLKTRFQDRKGGFKGGINNGARINSVRQSNMLNGAKNYRKNRRGR